MSVYKPKKSPFWHYDFQWQGRRLHGSTGARSKREALRHEERVRAKVRNGGTEALPVTLDEAAGLYEDKVGAKPSWSNAARVIKTLLVRFGPAALLSEITHRDLLAFVAERRADRSDSSVNREVNVWRAMWRHAADAEYDVGRMPKWGKLELKVAEKAPRELAHDEEEALFPALRDDLRDFCDFALKGGWRVSEVIGLRWSDVDFRARTAGTRIKGGDVVRRPLTPDMLVLIANQPRVGPFVFTYVAVRTKAGFVDKRGRAQPARKAGERYPITKQVIRKPWAAALAEAGVEGFRFHDLRHTRGTRILRATGNLKAAQRALAHRSIKTTLRYAHATDDDVRSALEDSESRNTPEPSADARKKA